MTHSFGDFHLKKDSENPILLSIPYVQEVQISSLKSSDEPKFIILASDGIWDFVTAKDAPKTVKQILQAYPSDLTLAANVLVMEAIKKAEPHSERAFNMSEVNPIFVNNYLQKFGKVAHDNQTVVIQQFHEKKDDWTPFTFEQLDSVVTKIKEAATAEAQKSFLSFCGPACRYKRDTLVIKYTEQYVANSLRSNGVPQIFRQWFRWYVFGWLPVFISSRMFVGWFNGWIEGANDLSGNQKEWYKNLINNTINRSYLK